MNKLVAILFTSSVLLASYSVSASLIEDGGYKSKGVASKSGKDDKSEKNKDEKSYASNKDDDDKSDKSEKNKDEKSYASNKDDDDKSDKPEKSKDEKSYASNKDDDVKSDKPEKSKDEKSYASNKDDDDKSNKSEKNKDDKNYASNKDDDDNSDKTEKIYGEKNNKIKIEDLYSDVKEHNYGKGGKVKLDGSDEHALSLSEAINAQAGIFDDPSFSTDVANILDMHFEEHGTKKGKEHKYASVTDGVLKSIKTKSKDGSLTSVKVKYSKGQKMSDKEELIALAKGTPGNSIYDTPSSIQSGKVALAVSEPSSLIFILMGATLLIARKKIAKIIRR